MVAVTTFQRSMLSFAPLIVGEFYQLLCHYCFLLKKVQVQIAKGADVPQNALRHTLDCLVMLAPFCLQVVLILVYLIV
jgi:hypothetical protein